LLVVVDLGVGEAGAVVDDRVDNVEGETLKRVAACCNDIPSLTARTSAYRPASPSFALR
jgi:hypothetical protein